MAMIKCKECGQEISNKAEKCPHCGATRVHKTGCLTWILFFFLGFVVLSVIGTAIGSSSKGKSSTTSTIHDAGTVYLNEPLNIKDFTIKITQVTETKRLGNYTAPMFLKLYGQITNNGADRMGLRAVLNSKRGQEFNCYVDDTTIIDNVKGAFDTKIYYKQGETKKGFIPFVCEAYLQGTKIKENNSRPSDYTMLIGDKEKTVVGGIRLETRPKTEETSNRQ